MQGTSDIRYKLFASKASCRTQTVSATNDSARQLARYPEALPIVLNGITILQTKRDPFNHKHPFEARLNKYFASN